MQLSSQYFFILLSLLILQAAASPASHVALASSPDSAFNNTILGAAVPRSFTIRPSSPGAQLGPDKDLAKTHLLFKVLQVLQYLALEDFNAESPPQTCEHPGFAIVIDGSSLESKSNILYKYALWGLYSAIWNMVANNFYREVTYKLLWEGSLVGWIRFIKRHGPAIGSSDDMNIDINSLPTAPPKMNSTLLGAATNVTSSSALGAMFHDGHVTVEIDMAGGPLSEADVFMTIFTTIVEMAPNSRGRIVRALSVLGNYNIWFRIDDPATPPRRRVPFLRLETVVWAVGKVPVAMTSDGGRWREMQMTIKVDDSLVGTGSMVAVSSAPLVLVGSDNLNVTTS